MDIMQLMESGTASLASGGDMFAVHYASESFSEAQVAPMAISAIAVFDLRSDSTRTFSRLDITGDADAQERAMLEGFYSFLGANRDAIFLHWNMGGMEFGFEAIAKRYTYLLAKQPTLISPREQFNVDKMIRARFGEDYAPHRRFESISRLNELDMRGFLAGPDEADAFKNDLWGDIVRSSATKSKLIAQLFRLLVGGLLRTNSSAGQFDFAGNRLDAATTVLVVGERFAKIQRSLRNRYGQRAPLLFEDEYDDQYLMGALLALFFDDVRPEDHVPEYAGGHSRVDFLLPAHGLVIELKHTRDGLSDRKLGEQLIIDKARYVKAANARHLIALVFDPGRVLNNPAGIEQDLQRDIGSAELAITVRIFN